MKLQEIIATERLYLRPLGPGDTEDVFRFASDPENARYMIYLPVRTREGTRQFLQEAREEWSKEAPSFFEYAILENPRSTRNPWSAPDPRSAQNSQDFQNLHGIQSPQRRQSPWVGAGDGKEAGGAVIGEISLWLHEGDAELGWILDKRAWNRGLITEAARALIGTARQQLSCQRFTAHCDDENAASYRVMEKLGMQMTDRYGGRKNRGAQAESMERFYTMPF